MLNATELKAGLAGFYGTDGYHKLSIFPGLVATDGVAWLCKNADCYWLFDEIALAQRLPAIRNNEMLQDIQFWQLTVNDGSAVLVCCEDEGKPVYEKEIPMTDFPLPEQKIWVGPGPEGTYKVALLPAEH
jgi:hypothetical protein